MLCHIIKVISYKIYYIEKRQSLHTLFLIYEDFVYHGSKYQISGSYQIGSFRIG